MADQATQHILTGARTEFASALSQVCSERGLEPQVVIQTIEAAILAAFRKDYGLEENHVYKVTVDADSGEAKVFKYLKTTEAKAEEAQAGVDYDESKPVEVTPPGFGRIASQTAKQVILQKIREAEKSAILEEFEQKVGTMISGMILRRDGPFTIVDIGRGQAVMPPNEKIPTEKYPLNKRLTFYIQDIRDTMKGRQIIVSRAAAELIEKLFDREVPEVSSGAVEIKKIAREAGGRTKLAVFSSQSGVDPVGSCVGQKGIRVQTVIDEVNGEKIDIIQYSDDPVRFLTAALSPAENLEILIDEEHKAATVTVPEDQLSLAIGREGQNVRLAAKLTGYKIDIKGPGGMLTESEKRKMQKEGIGVPETAELSTDSQTNEQEETEANATEEPSDAEGDAPSAAADSIEETIEIEETPEKGTSEKDKEDGGHQSNDDGVVLDDVKKTEKKKE